MSLENILILWSKIMIKENEHGFILIYSNDTFDVYYDKDTKRYHIDVFDDGHYWDEVWFDEYKEE